MCHCQMRMLSSAYDPGEKICSGKDRDILQRVHDAIRLRIIALITTGVLRLAGFLISLGFFGADGDKCDSNAN